MRRLPGQTLFHPASAPAMTDSGIPLRRRARAIDPSPQRALPASAATPRAVPQKNVFQRHAGTILAYGAVLVAAVAIAAIGYTAYAFSEYRGEILPNVYVSDLNLSGMSPGDAELAILNQQSAIHQTPVEFVYGRTVWKPTYTVLGVNPDLQTTANNAYSIGRSGDFVRNLIDRLPISRHFSIALVYSPHFSPTWGEWISKNLAGRLDRKAVNAWLAISQGKAIVEPGTNGRHVDTDQAVRDLEANLGSLSTRRVPVPLVVDQPYITDSSAAAEAQRINNFLQHPPVLVIGKERIRLDSVTLGSYLSAGPRSLGPASQVQVKAYLPGLQAYLYQLIGQSNRPVEQPLFSYSAGLVTVIRPARDGLRYGGPAAFAKFQRCLALWERACSIRVVAHTVRPIQILSSPASLGVTTPLGEGSVNLAGSSPSRLQEIASIAGQLNGVLIKPGSTISFDQYVNRGPTGTGWPALDYNDAGRLGPSGIPVAGAGGSMQEVATAVFRAGYAAGLPLVERHSHRYRLPWYTPPGMDATVTSAGADLRFSNDTGGYLLVQTRFEPIQQMLYVYLYGPKTGWTVSISSPKLTRTVSPGPPVTEPDPRLARGQRVLIAAAYPGYDYTVTRTVRSATGRLIRPPDTLSTDYQSRPATYLVAQAAQPTPSPTPLVTVTPTAEPTQ